MSWRLQPTTRRSVRHGWIRRFNLFHDLETNPRTQYSVHTWAQRFWLVNLVPVFYVFVFVPRLWVSWGLLLTTLYSLYANWATDNGAAAAAKTVSNTTPPTAQLEREIKRIVPKKYDI